MGSCPVFSVAGVMGKKWSFVVLQQVSLHHEGFNFMLKRIGKITPKVLSTRLKELEGERLISKEGTGHSTYGLTKKGKEIMRIFISIKKWNEKHTPGAEGCSARECATCPVFLS